MKIPGVVVFKSPILMQFFDVKKDILQIPFNNLKVGHLLWRESKF